MACRWNIHGPMAVSLAIMCGWWLDLLRHFIVFEEDPDSEALHKIIPGYHQCHAVNAAVEETVRASGMTETGSVVRQEAGKYAGSK